MEITEKQLQDMITAAISSKTEELTAAVQSQVERQLETEKGRNLNKAIQEGVQLYMDPGNGYEFAIVPLSKIDFNPLSRRTADELDPKSMGIKKLKKDIQVKGGLNRFPLVYRKDDRYVLIKGAKRVVALRELGEELTHAWILPAKPPMDMEEGWVNGY